MTTKEIDATRMTWTKETLVNELRRAEEKNAELIRNLIGLENLVKRSAQNVLNEINDERAKSNWSWLLSR